MMRKFFVIRIPASLFFVASFVVLFKIFGLNEYIFALSGFNQASVAAAVSSPFRYEFKVDGVLEETGEMENSSSPYWWLNSGGLFYLKNGTSKTVQGELSKYSKWRLAYSAANSADTDEGYHPQNIFRLVSRNKWKNFRQEIYYRVIKDNLSASPNRNASNGILLFNRYRDGRNLYYTGLRVDGAAIIKKKINGAYYTMAYKQYLSEGKYDKDSNPNLLPKNIWIGLRSEIKTNDDGSVSIKLYADNGRTGNWALIAEATDDGKSYGGEIISNEGYGGIRTDFMDVEFDDYKIEKI